VNVTDEDRFERNGQDLYTTSTLSIFTLILGGDTDVETPTGKVKLNIPAGTQTDQVFSPGRARDAAFEESKYKG